MGSDIYRSIATIGDSFPEDYRIDRESLFMVQAALLRLRSTCLRGRVGCVAVQDRRVVAMGYNGAPPGQPHCFELGCDVREDQHVLGCQRTVHAEANTIAFAARHGVKLEGATLYQTHGPCPTCAKLIVSTGIAAVVYDVPYRLPEGLDILDRASIPVRQYGVAR